MYNFLYVYVCKYINVCVYVVKIYAKAVLCMCRLLLKLCKTYCFFFLFLFTFYFSEQSGPFLLHFFHFKLLVHFIIFYFAFPNFTAAVVAVIVVAIAVTAILASFFVFQKSFPFCYFIFIHFILYFPSIFSHSQIFLFFFSLSSFLVVL